jgi:hypothetical protein
MAGGVALSVSLLGPSGLQVRGATYLRLLYSAGWWGVQVGHHECDPRHTVAYMYAVCGVHMCAALSGSTSRNGYGVTAS